MSVSINIDNVIKKFGDNTVIKGLSTKIKPGEFFTLLGPSGCGKTTLLRMIIGFNSIEGGTIKLDDTVINDIPTNKRNMGMVFQNYAIFPHMSVAENVAFGLKQRKVPKDQIDKMVDEILDVVKIGHLKHRMPTQMSGGQQQRVALARAIVIHPQVLLMDEPLSNLDAKLRIEMRNAIKSIQQQVGITTVYVTHDQEEALAVSDRIAVMHDGVIQQVGTPQYIYQRPSNLFVSTFIGLSNVIKAKLTGNNADSVLNFGDYQIHMDNIDHSRVSLNAVEGDGSQMDTADYQKVATRPNPALEAAPGKQVTVAVRPEEFIISTNKNAEGICAKVVSSVFLGVSTHYFMEMCDGKPLEIIENSEIGTIIPNGTMVKLQIKADRVNVFTDDGSHTIIRQPEGGEAK